MLYLAHVPNVKLYMVIAAIGFDVIRHIYNYERTLSIYWDLRRPAP
jgi:hypothetical protein